MNTQGKQGEGITPNTSAKLVLSLGILSFWTLEKATAHKNGKTCCFSMWQHNPNGWWRHWRGQGAMRGGGGHFLEASWGMVAPPSLPLLSLLHSHCQLPQPRANARRKNTSDNGQKPPSRLGPGQPCWEDIAMGAGCCHLRMRWECQGCKRRWGDLVVWPGAPWKMAL